MEIRAKFHFVDVLYYICVCACVCVCVLRSSPGLVTIQRAVFETPQGNLYTHILKTTIGVTKSRLMQLSMHAHNELSGLALEVLDALSSDTSMTCA